MAEENRELERRDGVRRDFRFDWEAVAACSPLYRRYVESERDRLGEEHPLFRTQYRLQPIAAGEGMFNRGQLAQLRGEHSRLRGPLDRGGCTSRASTWRGSRGGRASGLMVNRGGFRGSGHRDEPWGATGIDRLRAGTELAQRGRPGLDGGHHWRT